MFLLPKVDVNVVDLDNFTGVSRVLFVLKNSGNVDNHGGHRLDCLRDLVAIIKLNIISDLFEGAVEHGRIMGARVIEDVVLKAWHLANIFGGCSPPGTVPAIAMLATAAATVLLAVGCRRVGETGFLVGGCLVSHSYFYFPMMKFNKIIRMMRVMVIGNHPWNLPEKLTREP